MRNHDVTLPRPSDDENVEHDGHVAGKHPRRHTVDRYDVLDEMLLSTLRLHANDALDRLIIMRQTTLPWAALLPLRYEAWRCDQAVLAQLRKMKRIQ